MRGIIIFLEYDLLRLLNDTRTFNGFQVPQGSALRNSGSQPLFANSQSRKWYPNFSLSNHPYRAYSFYGICEGEFLAPLCFTLLILRLNNSQYDQQYFYVGVIMANFFIAVKDVS